jgi:hypothetical protein
VRTQQLQVINLYYTQRQSQFKNLQ